MEAATVIVQSISHNNDGCSIVGADEIGSDAHKMACCAFCAKMPTCGIWMISTERSAMFKGVPMCWLKTLKDVGCIANVRPGQCAIQEGWLLGKLGVACSCAHCRGRRSVRFRWRELQQEGARDRDAAAPSLLGRARCTCGGRHQFCSEAWQDRAAALLQRYCHKHDGG